MGWTQQPPSGTAIDSANTLTNGLTCVIPCNEGAGTHALDIIQNLSGVFSATNVGWQSASSLGGGGTSIAFSGTAVAGNGCDLYDTRDAYAPPVARTVALLFYPTGLQTAWQMPFGRGSIYTEPVLDWMFINDTTSNLRFYGAAGASFNSLPISNNAWHLAIGTCASGGTQQLILDGTATTTVAAGYMGVDSSQFSLTLGREYNFFTNDNELDVFNGQISLACIWNRVLASGEIVSFGNNPWQIFLSTSSGTGGFSPSAAHRFLASTSLIRGGI